MMTRNWFAALPAATLLFGGATVLFAVDSEAAEIPPSSAFNPVQRYAISYDDPRDVAEFYLRDIGIKPRDAEFHEVAHPSDVSVRIMLVTVDGIEDDAVQGIQWRFGMRTSEGSWEAVEAGMRRKCYRGANAGQWQKEVCP